MYNEMWTASCILLVFGAVFAGAGTLLKYYSLRGERYTGRAEARVVDIVMEPRTGKSSLSEFRNSQVAVFEFFADGKLVKVKDRLDTYPSPYYINQKVEICYNQNNPQEYQILKKNRWKQLAGCMNVLSIVSILAGCVLFLLYAARVRF